MMTEFRKFILRGNVVDLAVGIIIGAAFTGIVTSLVNDVIMPPIGWLLGGVDFSSIVINLPHSPLAAADAAPVTINVGLFINAIINFLIVAFAVFILVKQVNRFRKQEAAAPTAPPAPTTSEKLLTEIRDLLKAPR